MASARLGSKAYTDWEDRIGRRLPLWDLTVLKICVEMGSISKAAETVGLSKPAVSKILRGLEEELGTALVNRSWRGLEPTEAGRILLARSEAALTALDSALGSIRAMSASTTGELRIAANEVALSTFIADVITAIHAKFPRIVIEIVPAYTRIDQLRLLEQGEVELVVGQAADVGPQIEVIELFQDPLVVVAGEQSRWVGVDRIRLADLMDEPWAFSPLNTVSGRTMENAFRVNGYGLPRVSVVGSSTQLLRRLVTDNECLALFPRSLVEVSSGLVILPVEINAFWQPIGLLTVRHRTLSPLAKLFVDQTHEVIKRIGAATA